MEFIHKLEKSVAGWYKSMPHLPVNGQKWLADNVWWVALIGLILSVLSIFPIVAGILAAGVIVGSMGAAYGGAYGAAGLALTGGLLLAAWVTVGFFVLDTVILGLAVSPLKAHKKKGWDLLFILALINVVSVVVTGLITFNIMSIVFGLVWSTVGAYFLFEIHDRFGGKEKPVAHKPAKKEA